MIIKRPALADLLAGEGRRRIPLQSVTAAFRQAFPEHAGAPDIRKRVLDAIESLAAQGVLTIPRSGWDRGHPSLPPSVLLAATERQAPKAPQAWVPELSFAADERNSKALETLRSINAFLRRWRRDGKTRPLVPVNERSLDIFDDEKRLAQIIRTDGTLFGGRLHAADLGCFVTALPMPYETPSSAISGRPILIVENKDTYFSFVRWNETTNQWSAVAYAGGGHAKGIAYDDSSYLDTITERTGADGIIYFGDVDARGLNIAAGMASRRTRGSPVLPAIPFYEWLLANGRRAPHRSRETFNKEAMAWIGNDLSPTICRLIDSNQRIAQENFGYEAMLSFGQPS